MPGVGPRTAQTPRPQAAQLGRANPQSPKHPQQCVVALAGDRAAVGDAQQVAMVGIGERLRPPGLVPRHPHPSTASSRPSSHASALIIDRYNPRCRRRRRVPAATTGRRKMPTVGSDHVGIEIADQRRAAKL